MKNNKDALRVKLQESCDILKTIIESAYCTGVYGAFLLACYDEVREEFQNICKIGKSCSYDEAFLCRSVTT